MLITLRDVTVRFTAEPVLDGVNLVIQEGERVALVGRNGAGKSTLMRVVAGELEPDEGEREHAETLRIARLEQEAPPGLCGAVYDLVTRGLGETGRRLLAYERAARSGETPARLLELQHALEHGGAWSEKVRVDAVISRMNLDPDAEFQNLSGGLQRRVMLAQAVVGEPDLLLLDEPTNHLDIEGVAWLESLLLGARCAIVFISHDRAFLGRVATRIVEVDRGSLYNWPGDYTEYRRRKAEALHAEKQANREFDKKLAEEETWIRRGVKARTTRNMGRVRALEEMREQAARRRKYQKRARIRAQFGEQSSRRIIEAYRLNAAIAGKTVLRNFSHKIRRGDTVGVMGPNGSGKTTLLRVLLGLHAPDSGTLKYGENLQIAYFAQDRAQLNPERDAAWNVAEGAERIAFEDKSLHVLGYLRAFLFTPDRARTAVRLLSGGERNRLLLARLFAKPSNVLVLDEPTNDLDIETLELLEDLVAGYPGTVILVSHDRAFVNNVVDGLLVHEGERGFRYYVGNYDDWLRQRDAAPQKRAERAPESNQPTERDANRRPRKLSYKDRRDLEALPGRIEALEGEIAELYARMGDADFFRRAAAEIKSAQKHLGELEIERDAAFSRWEELEALRAEFETQA
jgi:ABC transport system ATP-binding/permease protein